MRRSSAFLVSVLAVLVLCELVTFVDFLRPVWLLRLDRRPKQCGTNCTGPWPNSLAARKHARNEISIDRIYYINMDKNQGRRAFMEGWLSKQTIPFERISGRAGDPSSDTCQQGKADPDRCRGIAGLAKTVVSTIESYNTTGLTFVFEDDYFAVNISRLEESIAVVPDDWDILRFDCTGYIPSDFPILHVEAGNELQIKTVFETRHDKGQPPCNATEEKRCWFCGGTHAMVWRGGESVQKLRKLWSRQPYDDIDCDLTHQVETYNVTSYCINFPQGQGVISKKIEGEISDIPKNK